MWTPFFFELAHFAISLFTALVFFATFWLYFDAWKTQKNTLAFFRYTGFLVLAISFVIGAVIIETSFLQLPRFQLSNLMIAQLVARNVGYFLILVGIFSEKLQKKPTISQAVGVPFTVLPILVLQLLPFGLALLNAFSYAIKSVVGLENHVKPVARAFALLSFFELLSLSVLLRGTENITIYSWVAPFGQIWVLQHVVLLISACIIGRWVFGYLLKQFLPQLFMILSGLILVIFLITTTVFTSLLLRNVQHEVLQQLENDVRVLEYALESKRTEAMTDAQLIAQTPALKEYVSQQNRTEIGIFAEQYLVSKKYSSLLIIDQQGRIIGRGEDREQIGGFVSSDPLAQRGLAGETYGSFSTTEGVLAPVITLRAVSPIISDEQTIGVVMVGVSIDNAFVDGIKASTGLEASLYGQETLAATTLVGADNTSRLSGLTEKNPEVIEKVIVAGQIYKGQTTVGNNQFFVANAPLRDADTIPVGMISVGRDQFGVLQTASRSLELTFMASVLLLVISIIPSYIISKYIADQL